MAYGRAGLGHDLRLACHGLDKNDNDFIVGLIGPQLAPLSMIVQRMRKTKQTSLHLEKLGPFFIGKVIWQSENENKDQESTIKDRRSELANL
jgi:chlorite dismutase